jgi:hypothetical protein
MFITVFMVRDKPHPELVEIQAVSYSHPIYLTSTLISSHVCLSYKNYILVVPTCPPTQIPHHFIEPEGLLSCYKRLPLGPKAH